MLIETLFDHCPEIVEAEKSHHPHTESGISMNQMQKKKEKRKEKKRSTSDKESNRLQSETIIKSLEGIKEGPHNILRTLP